MTAPSKLRVEGPFPTLMLGLFVSGLEPTALLLLGLDVELLGDLGLHLVGKGVHVGGRAVEAKSVRRIIE